VQPHSLDNHPPFLAKNPAAKKFIDSIHAIVQSQKSTVLATRESRPSSFGGGTIILGKWSTVRVDRQDVLYLLLIHLILSLACCGTASSPPTASSGSSPIYAPGRWGVLAGDTWRSMAGEKGMQCAVARGEGGAGQVDTNGCREEETEAHSNGVGEGTVWSSEDERMLFEWGWSKGVDRNSPIRPAMCPSSGCRGLVC